MIPEIQDLLTRLKSKTPVFSESLNLVHATILGKRMVFCSTKRRDMIQRAHRQGSFYEQEELTQLQKIMPENGIFVDIGANVGNHSLFFAKYCGAKKVYPFEPNPPAFNTLIQNVLVNQLEDTIDLRFIGVGVSDANGGGFAMEERRSNLGAAKMLEGQGDLAVYRGDELLADIQPDFVKIDVEGMEIKVLSGLSGVLNRCKPMIFIEVDEENETAFADWVAQNDYAIAYSFRRYEVNKNYLITPSEDVARVKESIED